MRPDGTPPGLGIQKLYDPASREWINLTNYLGPFQQFPSPGGVQEKWNVVETPGNINTYPAAAGRINSDGLVLMRGLLMKNSGNIATGDIVMTVPKNFLPRHPQQLRFFGGTCVLALEMSNRRLTVDIVFSATSWVNLGNVIYYLD